MSFTRADRGMTGWPQRTLPATWAGVLYVLQVDEGASNSAASRMPRGYDPNFVHCPSETTSTQPSTTLMAVCSSMA